MRIQRNEPHLVETDMTPMIDMVFQLIAFFMIVTSFENTKADERVKLPLDSLAKPPAVKPAEELVLNLGYRRKEDGSLADPEPFLFYAAEELRVDQFLPKLQQEARLYKAKLGDEGTQEVTVVVRADAFVPTGLVQELVQMCQEAGFEKFSIRAQQDQP